MELTPPIQKFIVHWGEMGTRWGVNRTVAQVHALLCLSESALHAEEIVTLLQVARSNVSTSLNELQNWGLVKVVQHLGDRRDYFESKEDVWEIFRIVLKERKKREIEPTLALLRECSEEVEESGQSSSYSGKRINEFLGFVETSTVWYERLISMPVEKVMGFANLPKKMMEALKRK
jgi:DNA-binding transcriptional regulator GbsR (MarR family)